MSSKTVFNKVLMATALVALVQCGSSAGGGATTSDSVEVSNLTELPSVTEIVGSSDANASISYAVTGTAPNLVDITEVEADGLFWNDLITFINADDDENEIPDNDIDQETFDAFWHGDAACHIAQDAGYSFQNISQAGTSLCYMKNAPNAASGVTIDNTQGTETSEDDTSYTASNLFAQDAADKIVKVQVTNMPFEGEGEGEAGGQDIYIKVYGTDADPGKEGYAVDLWFCNDGAEFASGFEQIRVNKDAKTMTSHNVDSGFGTFVMDFSGKLIEDQAGHFVFDPEQAQSATVHFEGEDSGSFKSTISVIGTTMISKSFNKFTDWENSEQTGMSYIISEFAGNDIQNLSFLSASSAQKWEGDFGSNAFHAGLEFQTDHYVYSGDLDDETMADEFDTDDFFADDFDALDTNTSSFACSGVTPAVTVNMDMGDAGMTSVMEQCENHFENMDFCNGSSIQQARSRIFSSEHFGGGE